MASPGGPSGVHLVAILSFDGAADIRAAFASPKGQGTAADLGTLADGGVDLYFLDTVEA